MLPGEAENRMKDRDQFPKLDISSKNRQKRLQRKAIVQTLIDIAIIIVIVMGMLSCSMIIVFAFWRLM